jgi:hypothetical protein
VSSRLCLPVVGSRKGNALIAIVAHGSPGAKRLPLRRPRPDLAPLHFLDHSGPPACAACFSALRSSGGLTCSNRALRRGDCSLPQPQALLPNPESPPMRIRRRSSAQTRPRLSPVVTPSPGPRSSGDFRLPCFHTTGPLTRIPPPSGR